VLASSEFAAQRADRSRQVKVAAISTATPTYPNTYLDMPDIATDSAIGAPPVERSFRDSIAHVAYEEAGLGPDDLSCAEVYDLSTALELDWYENIGLCAPGEAEALLHSGATTLGGRIPVNASGGLASFGEAIPAQAIAQVCELTTQMRGEAGERQVGGAKVGLSINQGLFGHGSCVIVTR
jgi:acetyl-CoA acetyltransferase